MDKTFDSKHQGDVSPDMI